MLQLLKASDLPLISIHQNLSNESTYSLFKASSLYRTLLNNKPYLSAFGGFLIMFIVGGYLAVGDLIPYMASYVTASEFRNRNTTICTEDVQYSYATNSALCNWLLTAWSLGYALFGCVGGMLRLYMQWSTRSIVLIGASIIVLQFLMAYHFSSSIYVMLCCFGIYGSGCGILWSPVIVCVVQWFPKNKALSTGVLLSAITLGSICFSMVTTLYINPNNIPNDERCGYSLNPQIIDQVPGSFLLLAFFCAMCALIGAMFLFDKTISIDHNCNKMCDTDPYTDTGIEYQQSGYDQEYSLKEALCSVKFWLIFGNVACNIYVLSFVYSDWKLFLENYILIENDAFLLTLNIAAAISNAVGRVIWGIFYDYLKSYKYVMFTVSFLFFSLVITMPFCNAIMSFIWVCLMWFCTAATYVIVPTALSNTFGDKYCAILTGFIMMSEIVATTMQSGLFLFIQKLNMTESTRWVVMCVINASFMVLSCFIALRFPKRNHSKELSTNNIKLDIQ